MPSAALPQARVVIEAISPAVDGGRYAAKRIVGDVVEVGADIFKDGHDLIAARVLYRRSGERKWRETPMEYDYATDRWRGRFTVDEPGRWQFQVEAWPDAYRTWREELRKRLEAGQDVSGELLEGARIVERSFQKLAKAQKKPAQRCAERLGSKDLPTAERLAAAFDEEMLDLLWGPTDPAEAHRHPTVFELVVDVRRAGVSAWYELFPRSQSTRAGVHGKFLDVTLRLPDIAAMGFDVIYLPPIHPIGRIHRKGRNNAREAQPGDVGSPWAIGAREGGHTAVHPDLGTIDDFDRLVWAAREQGIEFAVDFALQCAPDHPWVHEHPEWFFIRADGTIRYAENPPKKYEDIYPINFWCDDRKALWEACLDVLLFWVRHGVTIFRVDNPHTKPFAFWEWVIGEVKAEHPEVIFLAEAFTRPKRMKSLAKLGFSQSYTYFTWRNTKAELEEYLTELAQTDVADYFRPNFFANTPDILHAYLQQGGRAAFHIRLLLAATLSPTYGIYSGYELCENTALRPGSEEYLNSEKYELRVRNWNAPGNIKPEIALVNRIRRENPALQRLDNLRFVPTDGDSILCYWKHAPGNDLIIAVNLDPHRVHDTTVHVPLAELGIGKADRYDVEDLLTGARYTWQGERNYVRLDPAVQPAHVLRIVR